MLLWKLFGSEEAVQNAINQSVGYDISPRELPPQTPANTDKLTLEEKATDERPQFYFRTTWNEKQG